MQCFNINNFITESFLTPNLTFSPKNIGFEKKIYILQEQLLKNFNMASCNPFEHIDGLRKEDNELVYTYINFDGEQSIKTS